MQKAINGTVFWLIYSFRGEAPSGAMLVAGEVKKKEASEKRPPQEPCWPQGR